jgi:predicted short-subunit dehydrogenase-like oxidoreductase (DUF2520 family)
MLMHRMIDTLYIIGAGAAGSSLAAALQRSRQRIVGVMDRDEKRAKTLAAHLETPWATGFNAGIKQAGIVIVSVSDLMIRIAAKEAVRCGIPAAHQVWLHLSGALSPEALSPVADRVAGVGAFHPAHVFPPGEITPIAPGTRFGVDGDEPALAVAARLAEHLGGQIVGIAEESRPLYHAATVMASNGVVALLAEARNALVQIGVEKRSAEALLIALAKSAVRAGDDLGLDQALTGPIQRGDTAMVDRHLNALEQCPQTGDLYRTLGKAIVRLVKEGGSLDSGTIEKMLALLDSREAKL